MTASYNRLYSFLFRRHWAAALAASHSSLSPLNLLGRIGFPSLPRAHEEQGLRASADAVGVFLGVLFFRNIEFQVGVHKLCENALNTVI